MRFVRRSARMTLHGFDIPRCAVADFCRRHHIRKLSLFGSILRDDFGPDSDIDVLVEFEPGARVGLFKLVGMEQELSALLGRKVDLNTPGFFRGHLRERVIRDAWCQYDSSRTIDRDCVT